MDSAIQNSAPLLTITEAAAFLNVSKATIRRWTDSGRLSCLRIGARSERRFRESDLLKMIVNPGPNDVVSNALEARAPADSQASSGHQCIVSNTVEEEWAALAPAILSALDSAAQVLVVEVSDRKERLETLLSERGLNMQALLASHALICVSIEESYFLSGEFRWDRAVAFFESAILAAKARGFEQVLIVGADGAQAESAGHDYAQEMKKYELGVDAMLARHPGASVLCPYTASEISAQLMVQGFLTHSNMQLYSTPVRGLIGQVAI